MSSPKILFLTTQLPYPPTSGGTVKSWNYVKHLAANYELTIGTLLKEGDAANLDAFKEAIPGIQVISKKVDIPRSPLNLVKSYFTAPCLNAYRNKSNAFKKAIGEVVEQSDILLIDHYEVFQYVPEGYRGQIVMHTHNAEFVLWQRMAELTNNPIKKWILKYEASRVKKYEKHIFHRSDLIYATPSDIATYEKAGFDSKKLKITYHLGNDQLLDLPNIQFEETELAITFIGTLSWEPNIDGIVWFLNQVWPIVNQKHTDAKVYILGKNPDQRIVKAAKGDERILFTGFIKDLTEYLDKTRVYIAPLRFGSGMKVKVLEGMYRGVPSVTTSVGAEGLAVTSGEELFIADDAKAYAEHCIQLLEDATIWNQLRDRSRKTAAEKYRWDALFGRMKKELDQIK